MSNQPEKKQLPMPNNMYTRKMSNNSQKRSRFYLAFANQNLVSRITEMKHTWKNQGILDQAMVSISEDFETILRGQGLFTCPTELNFDDSYQNIIQSNIAKFIRRPKQQLLLLAVMVIFSFNPTIHPPRQA